MIFHAGASRWGAAARWVSVEICRENFSKIYQNEDNLLKCAIFKFCHFRNLRTGEEFVKFGVNDRESAGRVFESPWARSKFNGLRQSVIHRPGCVKMEYRTSIVIHFLCRTVSRQASPLDSNSLRTVGFNHSPITFSSLFEVSPNLKGYLSILRTLHKNYLVNN